MPRRSLPFVPRRRKLIAVRRRWSRMYRIALALCIAPLATPAVFFVGFWLAGDESEIGFLGFLMLFGVPAYVLAWVLGFPLAVAFGVQSRPSLWLHVVVGLVLGGAAGHAVDWLIYYGLADWELVVLSWVAGAASGAVYWLLAHKLLAAVERHDQVLYGP